MKINQSKWKYLFSLLSLCFAAQLAAQPYPNKPINLVVPQAAGGTNDIVARLIAPAFGEAIGASIVVENRPGAGGNIGTQGVARSAKDGYTLLLTINSAQAINPSLYKNPGFDPVNDLYRSITSVLRPMYWCHHPDPPIKR